MQFALQCRHDARGGRLTPRVFRRRTVGRRAGVGSLLERSGRFWSTPPREVLRPRRAGGAGVGALRPPAAAELRDTSAAARCGSGTRGRSRIDATPATRTSRSGGSTSPTSTRPGCARSPSAGRAGGSSAARSRRRGRRTRPARCGPSAAGWQPRDALPARRRELTRELLERFLAHVHARPLSARPEAPAARRPARSSSTTCACTSGRPGCRRNATYYHGEIPRGPTRACRASSTSS